MEFLSPSLSRSVSLSPYLQAQYLRASTATIHGAFIIPNSSLYRSIKRKLEDQGGAQEKIRIIKEESSQPTLTSNGREGSTGEEIGGTANPPPKLPEKGSISQERSKAGAAIGDPGIKYWKVREANSYGTPRAISLWLRATERIYCHRAPKAGRGFYLAMIGPDGHLPLKQESAGLNHARN
ncbi:unnamed protein product [Linum trigynum]|uniref:Uncharacterized protein n=1 Tax=Linum trigynum TaxID=586398 RepID=A0AAV2E3B2_9ROSI